MNFFRDWMMIYKCTSICTNSEPRSFVVCCMRKIPMDCAKITFGSCLPLLLRNERLKMKNESLFLAGSNLSLFKRHTQKIKPSSDFMKGAKFSLVVCSVFWCAIWSIFFFGREFTPASDLDSLQNHCKQGMARETMVENRDEEESAG